MIHWVLLMNRQGKVRLAKWYTTTAAKEKARIVKEVTQQILPRAPKLCNFVDWEDVKIVYRRYASLYFIVAVNGGTADPSSADNELITLEVIHNFVEVLDRYFGNVCELDLIFSFHRAYFALDEVLCAGEVQETSKKTALRLLAAQDALQQGPDPRNPKEQQGGWY